MDDAELLRRYVDEESDAAFSQLVHKHIHFVFAAAQRKLGGDRHCAEDVVQQVFLALARQAPKLARKPPVLAGWLYTVTRNIAAQSVRGERRRAIREREAQMREEFLRNDFPAENWEATRPLLEEALASLKPRDRDAIILRYFERRSYEEIGRMLTVSGDAARLRVERGLEKVRLSLLCRGISSTAAAVGTLLSAEAAVSAPAALAGSVSSAVIAAGASAAAGGSGVAGAAAVIHLMSANKVAAAFLLLTLSAGTGGLFLNGRSQAALHKADKAIRLLNAENAHIVQGNAALKIGLAKQDAAYEWNQVHRKIVDQLPSARTQLASLRKALQARSQQAHPLAHLSSATAETFRQVEGLVAAKDWDGVIRTLSAVAASVPADSYDACQAADTLGKVYWQGKVDYVTARAHFERELQLLQAHPDYASSSTDSQRLQEWLTELNWQLATAKPSPQGATRSSAAPSPDQWFPGASG